MATTSDADRLLAEGVPLTLTDGREVYLRYGMRALKMLEDKFGSLEVAQNALGGGGKMIGPLMDLLSAGLAHEGISADELLDLVDPYSLEKYTELLIAAFDQAFPASSGKGGAVAKTNGTNGSSGRSSTTSARSRSAGRTTSSGT